MYCYTIYRPSSFQISEFYLSVTRKYCFPTSFDKRDEYSRHTFSPLDAKPARYGRGSPWLLAAKDASRSRDITCDEWNSSISSHPKPQNTNKPKAQVSPLLTRPAVQRHAQYRFRIGSPTLKSLGSQRDQRRTHV